MKCALLFLFLPVFGGEPLRIATYNIQYLKYDELTYKRADQLREVVQQIGAEVYGLEEIQDRKALEVIFPVSQWQIIIDDESPDAQDLALVVSKRFVVHMKPDERGHFNADDGDFLFPVAAPDPIDKNFFPRRRDVLAVRLEDKKSKQHFWVLVHHAKSRLGGRANTTPRRIGASSMIVEKIKQRFSDLPLILLGDFNDTPDDASLNVLETGNPAAPAAMENEPGAFLLNLTEALWAKDLISWKWTREQNGLNIQVLGARKFQYDTRASNDTSKASLTPVLFDNMLVNQKMQAFYREGSIAIFKELSADLPASDHLPVYADFLLGE